MKTYWNRRPNTHLCYRNKKQQRKKVFLPVITIIEEDNATGVEAFFKKNCNPNSLVFPNADLPYLCHDENGFVAENVFENK